MKKSCMDKNQFAKRLQDQKTKYYRVAYSYVKNEHDALDIIGEATYKGLKDLHTLQQPEDSMDLFEALDALSERDRACVLLRYFEEYSFVKIAEILQEPEPTVKSRIYRALGKMREFIEEGRTKKIYKWVMGTAAAFCVMFCGANVNPIYTYAAQIPVLGVIVQVLHVGSGGERTDGVYTKTSLQGETVEIHFEGHSEKMNTAPVYSVEHLMAPNRMSLTLHGVRGIDFETIKENMLATSAVKDVYRTMIGDDSMCGFTVVLNSGYTYQITECADPAYLSIRFLADEDYQPDRKIYYLRSESMPFGEELGLLNELYDSDGATQLKTKSGKYIVTIGQYDSMADAEKALKALNEKYGDDTGFTVDGGSVDEIPGE